MKSFCTNKLLILILAAIFIGVLCSCTKDVSQDPQYNYGFKYNHVYKTIDETILEKESDFKTLYFLDKINEAGKKDMDDYLSLESKMVALPKGTLFRVERLTRVINPENKCKRGYILSSACSVAPNVPPKICWHWPLPWKPRPDSSPDEALFCFSSA